MHALLEVGAVARVTHRAAADLHLRPLAVSSGIVATLARGDTMMASNHRHGVSLSFPATATVAFMSVPGAGLLPAHIVLRACDLARVRAAIAAGAKTGCIGSTELGLRFDLAGIRVFRPWLAPKSVELDSTQARAAMATVADWLCTSNATLGLGTTAEELLAPDGRWVSLLAAARSDARAAESALRALIGRGAGTTPAGDDVVLGAIAHAWARRGEYAVEIAALRNLLPELPALTTRTSAAYLTAAAHGEFGSHLVAFVRALPQAPQHECLRLAQRVAGHGATSGLDTLAGFAAAAQTAAPLFCSLCRQE